MHKADFIKCLALFLFSISFLYGVGHTYHVEWLQFRFLADSNENGFSFSFSSLIPVLGGLLIVAIYEVALKRIV